MNLNIDSKKDFIIFDHDDTLYKELDYLKSAYSHISNLLIPDLKKNIYREMIEWYLNKQSTFDKIKEKYRCNMTIPQMVYEYRYHIPTLRLDDSTRTILDDLKNASVKIGIITDGRSKSQRNKLKSLGIEKMFDLILISEEFGSEKPTESNFNFFSEKFKTHNFIYIGDNYKKDFISPNKLGWITIGILDDGRNIHKQDMSLPNKYHPQHLVKSFQDINLIFS